MQITYVKYAPPPPPKKKTASADWRDLYHSISLTILSLLAVEYAGVQRQMSISFNG